jgi:hypothetical protein
MGRTINASARAATKSNFMMMILPVGFILLAFLPSDLFLSETCKDVDEKAQAKSFSRND